MESPWGPAGLSICYDLRFPELLRRYAVAAGAKLMLLCAEWPLVRVEHWRALLVARAIETSALSSPLTLVAIPAGPSSPATPWSSIPGKGARRRRQRRMLLTAEIDLAEVDRVRETIPIFEDRRPDAYQS